MSISVCLSVYVSQCACLCVLFVCLLFVFLASDVCFWVYTRACTLGPYFPAALRLSQTSLSLSAANPANEADTLQFSFSMSAAE